MCRLRGHAGTVHSLASLSTGDNIKVLFNPWTDTCGKFHTPWLYKIPNKFRFFRPLLTDACVCGVWKICFVHKPEYGKSKVFLSSFLGPRNRCIFPEFCKIFRDLLVFSDIFFVFLFFQTQTKRMKIHKNHGKFFKILKKMKNALFQKNARIF